MKSNWAVLPLLLFLIGCGPSYGDLKGKVSFKEKPLAVGSVQIVGSDGLVKTGAIRDDGTFEIPNIIVGPITAAVNSPNPAGQKFGVRKKDEPPPTVQANPKWFAIPNAYASFEKPLLTFDVKPGPNIWDIDLK
jgi:hypothetical protein